MSYEKKIMIYEDVGDDIGFVEYVQHTGTDLTVVNSARVSFGVQKDELDARDEKLIKYLIEHKHTSTLEHNFVTFRFKVPLFIAAQHMRHRTWSYNQISRRYTDVDLEFYEPSQFRTQHESNRQASNPDDLINPELNTFLPRDAANSIVAHHKTSLQLYNKLIASGVCREQARGVLPQNLYAEYWGSVNLNNLLKFVGLRLHGGAQWEIQQVAQACLDIVTDLWPVAIGNYRQINDL